jgi:hypothetical protein
MRQNVERTRLAIYANKESLRALYLCCQPQCSGQDNRGAETLLLGRYTMSNNVWGDNEVAGIFGTRQQQSTIIAVYTVGSSSVEVLYQEVMMRLGVWAMNPSLKLGQKTGTDILVSPLGSDILALQVLSGLCSKPPRLPVLLYGCC